MHEFWNLQSITHAVASPQLIVPPHEFIALHVMRHFMFDGHITDELSVITISHSSLLLQLPLCTAHIVMSHVPIADPEPLPLPLPLPLPEPEPLPAMSGGASCCEPLPTTAAG